MNYCKLFIASVLLILLAVPAMAQKKTITGTITDAGSGAPVEGAAVKVKSSGSGTVSQKDGSFSIEANADDVLEITSIGYSLQSVNVKNQSQVNVQLRTSFQDLDQVVMLGSRRSGRVKTESAVPIDVISMSQARQTTAKSDLTSMLNTAAPSFNYNKQSGSDGADAVDLATLRGLGPDQTLVLVNGKRRHQTSFVAMFGTRGRGNSGTDLNAIPEASIDRVEILRDGASAQYGSDAIAGVINIILKKDLKHLTINTGWAGYYDTKFNALKSVQPTQYYTGKKLDGNTGTIGINYGVPIGKQKGFINFSGNFLLSGRTFRQVPDTNYYSNPDALPVNSVRRANGDGKVTSGGVMINAEIPVAGSKSTFYAFGGYNAKQSSAYAYTRNFSGRSDRFPTDVNGNLIFVPGIMHQVNPAVPVETDPTLITSDNDIYYNPLEKVKISDVSMAVGLKGTSKSKWDWDISNTFGRNNFHYYGDQTFNASLGSAKTDFDDGGFNFLQNTTNLDLSKHYNTVAEGLNLGLGAEFRFEQYSIFKGEEASYANFNPDKATGAQGFPGFQPSDEITDNRSNVAAYADVEIDLSRLWLINGAIRFENYSDFGSLATFKFATRYKVADNFNIRGSVSTGYRAPSLQQINFSNTFTNVQGSKITEVKLAPNYSPITKAAGIPNLKQEKSVNASIGFTWKPIKALTITIDGYLVKIKDRVVLSGYFDTSIAAIKPILEQLEVSQAQFFANAVNTTNTGIDIIVDYNKKWGNHSFKALFAGNIQKMKIDKINVPSALNDTYIHQQTFFNDREQKFALASAPPVKFNLGLEYGINKFSVGTHLTYFGKIQLLGYGEDATGINPQIPTDVTGDYVPEVFNYNGKLVTDLYFSYKICKKATVYWGADNLFNVHPDLGAVPGAHGWAYDGETGGPWDGVQMGFNGLRLFTKLSLNF